MNPHRAEGRFSCDLRRPGARRLWFALVIAAAVSAGRADETSVVSAVYRFDAPRTESSGDCTRLTVTDCGQLHRIGEPAMPFRTARLLLPAGFTVGKVEVVPSAEPARIDGHWRIEYAGQPHSRLNAGESPFAAGDNRLIYASDAPYPASAAELISVQRMMGYDIALVRVFPIRYKPASGQLWFTPEVTLRLSLAPMPAGTEPPLRPPARKMAADRVAAFVDNPEIVRAETEKPSSAGGAAGSAFDYLLVTSSNLASAFEPLMERKKQDGLAVKVAFLETITNTISGRDVPEKIRNYIRQAYTNWGIAYVLLGGGTAILPCRYAYVRVDRAPQDSYLPTDLYFACLDGSWNGNGDRHWGEATDGDNGGDVDLLAEVYVGRAPVSTVEQAATFVEKTVRYETGAGASRTNALLMATYLGGFSTGPCQGAAMYKPLLPLLGRFRIDWLDDTPHELPQWTRTEALAALNRSPHVVLYNGHGTADILMRLHAADLKGLTNEWPFFLCSVGCSAAEFDHGKFWPDSIGESLVTGSRHGAFAAVLNARAGWFDPQYPWEYSGEFQTKLFEELLRRENVSLGFAHQRGKEDLAGQVERAGAMTYRWCYYGMTLLGDPHAPFRFAPAPVVKGSASKGAGE